MAYITLEEILSKCENHDQRFSLDTPVREFIEVVEIEMDIPPALSRVLKMHGYGYWHEQNRGFTTIKDLILSYRNGIMWTENNRKILDQMLKMYGFYGLAPKRFARTPLYKSPDPVRKNYISLKDILSGCENHDPRFSLETPIKEFIETIEKEIDIPQRLRILLKNPRPQWNKPWTPHRFKTIKDLILSYRTSTVNWIEKDRKILDQILRRYGFYGLAPKAYARTPLYKNYIPPHSNNQIPFQAESANQSRNT